MGHPAVDICISFRRPPRSEGSKDRVSEGEDPPDSTPSGPSYFLSFSPSASDEVIGYIVKQLESQDIQCELLSGGASRSLRITTRQLEVLAKQVASYIANTSSMETLY